jgi:DNA processing protein
MAEADEAEHSAATAALALLRAGRLQAPALVTLLRDLAGQMPLAHIDGAAVLAAAGLARAAVNASMAAAERDLGLARGHGIRAMALCSPRFPPALQRLADAPPLLFLRGNPDRLQPSRTVALVGTRRATGNGQAIAGRLAGFLIDNGWTVLSGLNPGIDAAVQAAAWERRHAAVAVVSQGLDRLRPRAMAESAAQLLDHGGVLVSEQVPGAPADADSLANSHRLQVALSLASVIVEGGRHGASAPHADHCQSQAHGLFAVVPEGVSTQRELPRYLVAERGAQAIASRDDYPALLARLEDLSASQAE